MPKYNKKIQSKKIKKVIIKSEDWPSTIDDIEEGTLIITSGDREDTIQPCIKSNKFLYAIWHYLNQRNYPK